MPTERRIIDLYRKIIQEKDINPSAIAAYSSQHSGPAGQKKSLYQPKNSITLLLPAQTDTQQCHN
jgi:hypothetical protein